MGTITVIAWGFLITAVVMAAFIGIYVGWTIGLEKLMVWRYRRANRRGRDIVGM